MGYYSRINAAAEMIWEHNLVNIQVKKRPWEFYSSLGWFYFHANVDIFLNIGSNYKKRLVFVLRQHPLSIMQFVTMLQFKLK